MNIDLLYPASLISGDRRYADLATVHAETTRKYHIRSDFSTFHMLVYDPFPGEKKVGLTHPGYSPEYLEWRTSLGSLWVLHRVQRVQVH